jgi:hypothetical protein
MPQTTNPPAKKKKKKDSGIGSRIPAHQNKFAFHHNPKSKKTATILASPIQYCCRRCYDKIVWRKRYRKYKPLTQPTKCNLCQQRNVTAAYHTICDRCSLHHTKTVALLQQWNHVGIDKEEEEDERQEEIGGDNDSDHGCDAEDDDSDEEEGAEDDDRRVPSESVVANGGGTVLTTTTTTMGNSLAATGTCNVSTKLTEKAGGESCQPSSPSLPIMSPKGPRYTRVCTVCCKQPALPDGDTTVDPTSSSTVGDTTNKTGPHGQPVNLSSTNAGKPLKLRQVKSIRRQQEKQAFLSRNKNRIRNGPDDTTATTNNNNNDDNNNNSTNDDCQDKDGHSRNSENSDDDDDDDEDQESDEYESDNDNRNSSRKLGHQNPQSESYSSMVMNENIGEDADDPFLKAVGGVQNLLVGEAYQKMLLDKKASTPTSSQSQRQYDHHHLHR